MKGWALLGSTAGFLLSHFTFLFSFLSFIFSLDPNLLFLSSFALYIVLACLSVFSRSAQLLRSIKCTHICQNAGTLFPCPFMYYFCFPSSLSTNGIRSRVRVSWLVQNRSFAIILQLSLLVLPKSGLLCRFLEFRFQIRRSATLTQISPGSFLPRHSHFNVRRKFSISLATKLPVQLRKLC